MKLIKGFLYCFLIFGMVGCASNEEKASNKVNVQNWEEVVNAAKGKTATMMMYMGGDKGLSYMNDYVIPTLKKQYDITLQLVPGQGKEIVAHIISEKEAGKAEGQIDVVWINGETFYQLRQIDGLYGPYNQYLPNYKKVDTANPIVQYDFQENINGYETPWSIANFALLHDSAQIADPPTSMQDFAAYWAAHPGKFTIPDDFSGYTLLKSWLIELAGSKDGLDGKFDSKKYASYSTQLWKFINDNKKNFWKQGATFPASNTLVTQMFASGELDFAMSFSNADLDIKIAEKVFKNTVRPLVPKAGSMQNTNYVGIPYNASNKEVAMVIANFLISPEAQAAKANLKYSGSRTVLDQSRLSTDEKKLFEGNNQVKYALKVEALASNAIKEPVPEYMIKVAADFRTQVIEKK